MPRAQGLLCVFGERERGEKRERKKKVELGSGVAFPAGCFSGELPSYATVLKSSQVCGTKDYSTNPLLIVLLMVFFLKSYFFPRISHPDRVSPSFPKCCLSLAFDQAGHHARRPRRRAVSCAADGFIRWTETFQVCFWSTGDIGT